MDARQVFEVLHQHGVTELYHANSVTTGCSLLTAGGLASRQHVEQNGMHQTSQRSDASDQRYGVWNDIFTDMCDIHVRGSNVIYYGPVLFILRAQILQQLPRGTDVQITKTNAQYWTDLDPEGSRYFNTIEEFRANIFRYDFGQSITFRNRNGIVPFGTNVVRLLLDDPQIDNNNVFEHASSKLAHAAEGIAPTITIDRRRCVSSCKCRDWYRQHIGFVRTMF